MRHTVELLLPLAADELDKAAAADSLSNAGTGAPFITL
jgi:hypothetical protein